MNTTLIHAVSGIPIHVIEKDELTRFLKGQSSFVVGLINIAQGQKQNTIIIPSEDGQSIQCVCLVVESKSDIWIAGDLAAKLPEETYQFVDVAEREADFALGFALGAYQFNAYKSKEPILAKLAISEQSTFELVNNQVEAIYLTRDLVNTPAADMMPQHLSEVMEELAQEHNANFTQLIGDELLEHNYPTIHMVGRASDNKPRLLDLSWGDENAPKLTLVGKGVCFDSGGLDLKPAAGMRNMKKDMGGAAHVIGLAKMIMAANLNVRLRVIVPAVENAVSKNAFRPGDVIKTRKGITVEIDNTDAEGRLILCDALAEAQADSPELLIDFATLTGACRIALGTELPGFFSSDRSLALELMTSGEQTQDPVWNLPLFDQYKALFKSDVADISNCGSTPFGGAITAALYLKEFVEPEQTPWVHFDVMAWNMRTLPGRPAGGEALGLRAAFHYLSSRFSN